MAAKMTTLRSLARPNGFRIMPTGIVAARVSRVGVRLSSTAPTPATVADSSFWRSLVPKPLRKENRKARAKGPREWNPATYFIVLFLLIGSMSIQMIALRNSFERYMRQSEARIGTLREVVERIQRGEKVDVEQALGTGNAQKEADWEELLQAIERDETARNAKKQEKPKQAEAATKSETTQHRDDTVISSEGGSSKKSKGGMGSFF